MAYRTLARENSAHIARSNELIADVREALREIRLEVALTREVVRSNEAAFRDGSRMMTELVSQIRELREDSRAHTRALLALIDRLENGGANPAT